MSSISYILKHPEKLREYTDKKKEYHILNLGAGVQSTTVYLLNMQGKITPKFDVAIFADTQEEPKAVYEHLKWLKSLGGPPIWIRTKGSLGDNLLKEENSTKQRFVSIPAYTAPDDAKKATGITRRQCTSEYKIIVIDKTIREDLLGLKKYQRWPKNIIVHNYFGISADEARRSKNIIKTYKVFNGKKFPHFPLLEFNWTRADCIEYLKEHVPHDVPRSACVFCPYKSNFEWLQAKKDPEAWARIVQIDKALRTPGLVVNRNMNQKMYLHNSAKPIDEIDFEELIKNKQDKINKFTTECKGMCGL